MLALSDLPLPRLQLTWKRRTGKNTNGMPWRCTYQLLIPLGKHDIRVKKGRNYQALKIAHTNANIGSGDPVYPNGELSTPFRDGAHAMWDSYRLNIPAFVVYGDMVKLIEPKEPKE